MTGRRCTSGGNRSVVDPQPYERWRRSRIGALTESTEKALVFGLAPKLQGLRVLDVGCGDGTYGLEAAARGARVVGIDSSLEMLKVARRRAGERKVDAAWVLADATALPFDTAAFDLLLGITVLCFVKDAPRAVREMARAAVPGGRILIGGLSPWSIWAAWRRLRAFLGSTT